MVKVKVFQCRNPGELEGSCCRPCRRCRHRLSGSPARSHLVRAVHVPTLCRGGPRMYGFPIFLSLYVSSEKQTNYFPCLLISPKDMGVCGVPQVAFLDGGPITMKG